MNIVKFLLSTITLWVTSASVDIDKLLKLLESEDKYKEEPLFTFP